MEEVLSNVTQDWMKQIEAKEHEVKAAQHQVQAAQMALKEMAKERYEAQRERDENKSALPVCDIQPGTFLFSIYPQHQSDLQSGTSINEYLLQSSN